MRQFVAGTGGNGLYQVTPIAGEEAFQFTRHGVLSLDLSPGQYVWQFIATDGDVMDQGVQVNKPTQPV
jgi:hypothetical protein